MAPPPLRRPADGAAFAELKERLRAAGVFAPTPGFYARKLCEVVALWALCVGLLAAAWRSPWALALTPLYALASGQTVLLAHDVSHGSAFSPRSALGRVFHRWLPHVLIGGLAGGSARWWNQSHNRTHHALSNDPDLDPDIDYPFLAFDRPQALAKSPVYLPFLRRQHVLIWAVMPGAAVTMRMYSVAYLVRRLSRPGMDKARLGAELALLTLHWCGYFGLVFLALPQAWAVAFVIVHQAGFGLYLALITATNHWAMPMPRAEEWTFLEHQVMTSRNIRGGALVRFLYGGLDAQIEHHLFARLPRPRAWLARPIVRAFCQERGIPYEEVTPSDALARIYRCLRSVAEALEEPAPARSHVDEPARR